jgi:small subunit ribosomal protein S14
MAKTSQIHRNLKRQKVAARFATKRKELKEIIRNPQSSEAEKAEAQLQMQAQPRDASATRIRNRCRISGRARGYYRKFQISRIALREMALRGDLPGVVKASW